MSRIPPQTGRPTGPVGRAGVPPSGRPVPRVEDHAFEHAFARAAERAAERPANLPAEPHAESAMAPPASHAARPRNEAGHPPAPRPDFPAAPEPALPGPPCAHGMAQPTPLAPLTPREDSTPQEGGRQTRPARAVRRAPEAATAPHSAPRRGGLLATAGEGAMGGADAPGGGPPFLLTGLPLAGAPPAGSLGTPARSPETGADPRAGTEVQGPSPTSAAARFALELDAPAGTHEASAPSAGTAPGEAAGVSAARRADSTWHIEWPSVLGAATLQARPLAAEGHAGIAGWALTLPGGDTQGPAWERLRQRAARRGWALDAAGPSSEADPACDDPEDTP